MSKNLNKESEEGQVNTIVMPRNLTAENGAKGLLVGEFFEEYEVDCPECYGDGCYECEGIGTYNVKIPITWTNIKAIYAKVVEKLGG